jgi:hypothetical protein
VQAIGSTLGVLLPAELFQEQTSNPRIKRKKVYFGLILMSGDDDGVKADALAGFLELKRREWVRFLEWRDELLQRIVRKSGKMEILSKNKVVAALTDRIPQSFTEIISTSESIWQTESIKEAFQKNHLGSLYSPIATNPNK